MTDKDRIFFLAEEIELAKKRVSEWPEWLRANAHFVGSNHPSEEAWEDVDEAQKVSETVRRG
jgi:hypothetical protein